MSWIGSPNYTQGRQGTKIDRVYVHWMVGTLASTDSVFQNKAVGTSAHYGIENGNIHQYVGEENTAYHAGTWTENLRSVGIEHSAAPGRDATQATLETSARLIAEICKRHGIPIDRAHIRKHSENIATQCPGTIPIDWLVARAKQINVGGDGQMIIQNQENWYARCNKTHWQIRGRALDRNVFRAYVGRDFLHFVEDCSDDKEADVVQNWQTVGKLAVKDKWQQQIYDVQAALKKAPSSAELEKAKKQAADLQKQMAEAEKRATAAEKKAQDMNVERIEAEKVGNAFLLWLGSILKSITGGK